MEYLGYKYLYPPRPEIKISASSLLSFENMGKFLAQPKLNGSSMLIFTNGIELIVMNRHKERLAHKMNVEELKKLHRGSGWMVLCGEYMNKAQKDENNILWNIKYVIFDIIVFNGKQLIGTTFQERYDLLCQLYPNNPAKLQLHYISENCFRVNSVTDNFERIYNQMTIHGMYEGLVMKRIDGKLENGTSSNNNVHTQIKCRKSTKNYAF